MALLRVVFLFTGVHEKHGWINRCYTHLTPCLLFHRCSLETRMYQPLLHTPYSVSSSFSQLFIRNSDVSTVVTHTLFRVFFFFTGVHGKHGRNNRCYKHIFGALHCKICEDKPPGLAQPYHPPSRALRLRAVNWLQ